MLSNAIIGTASAIALAMTLGIAGTAHAQASNPTSQQTTSLTTSDYITKDEAKESALIHAGVDARDAYDMDIVFEVHAGITRYDVEFKADDIEYNYDIDAVTGAVLHWQTEIDH